jgi:hypothetical protein
MKCHKIRILWHDFHKRYHNVLRSCGHVRVALLLDRVNIHAHIRLMHDLNSVYYINWDIESESIGNYQVMCTKKASHHVRDYQVRGPSPIVGRVGLMGPVSLHVTVHLNRIAADRVSPFHLP